MSSRAAVTALAVVILVAKSVNAECRGDFDGNGHVTVAEVLTSLHNALNECSSQASSCTLSTTGQTATFTADKHDGISAPVAVPDDGTVKAGAVPRFVDNGDGTITDLNAGLMWEKKDDAGGLHDLENIYVWSGNGAQETIWDWLDDVNAETHPVFGGMGFAGYNDWRIPNVNELGSLVNYGASSPAVNSVFHTGCARSCSVATCSCTNFVESYWSSTTSAADPMLAWVVNFRSGFSGESSKDFTVPGHVRAVRGPVK